MKWMEFELGIAFGVFRENVARFLLTTTKIVWTSTMCSWTFIVKALVINQQIQDLFFFFFLILEEQAGC